MLSVLVVKLSPAVGVCDDVAVLNKTLEKTMVMWSGGISLALA